MQSLLSHDEPSPYSVERERGSSAFFLICDHAGARIPRRLGSLGLGAHDLLRHIAWDIGAAAVTRELSARWDATAVLQTYSRLVIDCNRPLTSSTSIVTSSERTTVPGNQFVSDEEVGCRQREVFQPYHDRIVELLDDRSARGQSTVLISVHSFTPVFLESPRAWDAGVLYHRDARLAHALLDVLRSDPELVVGDNEPYAVSDDTDYAIPEYGERRGLPHVEIEIRQDLIADEKGQNAWAARLADALTQAWDRPR